MTGRRLCLVTGASAGIGAAFARVYARYGYDLAITARRADRLETLAAELRTEFGVGVDCRPADLADPAAPAALIAGLERPVDVLVNNAGYGLLGGFAARDWAEHQAFLQVLTVAPVELAHLVLPGMVERRFGRILNVASLLGLTPAIPQHGLYSAAKAFMVKFSETLHQETLGTGVHVTAVCPGLTRSEFHAAEAMRRSVEAAPAWVWMESEPVAKSAYAAAEANRPICVPGAPNRVMAGLMRALPEPLGLALMARGARRRP